MAGNQAVKGIIFDMDNTLLQSRIDFAAMKQDIFGYLGERRLLPEGIAPGDHTTGTLITAAKKHGIAAAQLDEVWEIAARHEVRGMEGAGLEPGAAVFLEQMGQGVIKAIITNNAYEAAVAALEQTRIAALFDAIAGREHMETVKPSPSGYFHVMNQFPQLASRDWLAVGDSWIDGAAANAAGVAFVGYRAKEDEMRRKGVRAEAFVRNYDELADWIAKRNRAGRYA
jgi:phosphoglycolate phosphatase